MLVFHSRAAWLEKVACTAAPDTSTGNTTSSYLGCSCEECKCTLINLRLVQLLNTLIIKLLATVSKKTPDRQPAFVKRMNLPRCIKVFRSCSWPKDSSGSYCPFSPTAVSAALPAAVPVAVNLLMLLFFHLKRRFAALVACLVGGSGRLCFITSCLLLMLHLGFLLMDSFCTTDAFEQIPSEGHGVPKGAVGLESALLCH